MSINYVQIPPYFVASLTALGRSGLMYLGSKEALEKFLPNHAANGIAVTFGVVATVGYLAIFTFTIHHVYTRMLKLSCLRENERASFAYPCLQYATLFLSVIIGMGMALIEGVATFVGYSSWFELLKLSTLSSQALAGTLAAISLFGWASLVGSATHYLLSKKYFKLKRRFVGDIQCYHVLLESLAFIAVIFGALALASIGIYAVERFDQLVGMPHKHMVQAIGAVFALLGSLMLYFGLVMGEATVMLKEQNEDLQDVSRRRKVISAVPITITLFASLALAYTATTQAADSLFDWSDTTVSGLTISCMISLMFCSFMISGVKGYQVLASPARFFQKINKLYLPENSKVNADSIGAPLLDAS